MQVSVILITYNHERYVAQALDGVLAQRTAFPFEVLVSEDCSTDATRDIVVDYARRHPDRIRLFLSKRNLNTRRVMSRALAAVRGRYVALLDGDDYWTAPDKLQRQVDYLEAHPECSLCFHTVQVVYEDGNGTGPHRFHNVADGSIPYHPGAQEPPPAFAGIEDAIAQNRIPGCAPLIRRDALGDLPSWYDEAPVWDWPLYILAAEKGLLGYIDEVYGVYRRHSGGVWSSKSRRDQWASAVELFDFYERHLPRRHRRAVRRARARYRGWFAQEAHAGGDLVPAMVAILRALRDDPRMSSPEGKARLRLLWRIGGQLLIGAQRSTAGS